MDCDSVAHKRLVKLSRRTGLDAAVASGLGADERVVVFPSDATRDGVRITDR